MQASDAPASASAANGPGAVTDQAAVLSAMLRIAEGEIRSKDEQHNLLQQIIATNEKELADKSTRIAELEAQVVRQAEELEEFKALFDKYLSKAEAQRKHSAFQPGAAPASPVRGRNGSGIPGGEPTSLAAAGSSSPPRIAASTSHGIAASPVRAAPLSSRPAPCTPVMFASAAAASQAGRLGPPPDTKAPQARAVQPVATLPDEAISKGIVEPPPDELSLSPIASPVPPDGAASRTEEAMGSS